MGPGEMAMEVEELELRRDFRTQMLSPNLGGGGGAEICPNEQRLYPAPLRAWLQKGSPGLCSCGAPG